MAKRTKPETKLKPAALRAREFDLDDEEYVVFSYPITNAPNESSAQSSVGLGLTAAEREVAKLVIAGKSNAEIAAARGRAVSTVAKQLESIYLRLGINSRRELALVFSDENGLDRPSPERPDE